MTMRLLIKKCIFGVSKGGTPYHYWREVKEMKPVGLYHAQEINIQDGQEFSLGSTIILNKKELLFFEDLILEIEEINKKILRDWKIKKIIQR